MQSWLKSWGGPLLLILGTVLCGIWWILLFSEVNTVEISIPRENLPDTTYVVVPEYTKYYVEYGDTTYIFYNKDKKPIVKYSTKQNK